MQVNAVPATLPVTQWQRTSWRQLLRTQLQLLKRWSALLISQVILSSTDTFGELGQSGLFAFGVFFLIFSLLRFEQWRRLQFRTSPDLEVRSGLFRRQQEMISQDSLSDVHLGQSFAERMMGIYTLRLDRAGGAAITLPGLSREALASLSISIPESPGKTSESFYSTFRDATASGVLLTPLILVCITIAGLFTNDSFVELHDYLQVEKLWQSAFTWAWWQWGLCAGLSIVCIAGMLAAATYLWHYPRDFALSRDKFTLRSGSVFRRYVALSAHRVQSIIWQQNIFERRLQRWSMQICATASQSDGKNDARLFGLTKEALVQTLHCWLPAGFNESDQPYFQEVNTAFLQRKKITTMVCVMMMLIAGSFLLMWMMDDEFDTLICIAGIGGWCAAFITYLRCASRDVTKRYLITDDALYLRDGRWTHRFTWLPWSQVQHIQWEQGRHGLSHQYVTLVICNGREQHDLKGFDLSMIDIVNACVLRCSKSGPAQTCANAPA